MSSSLPSHVRAMLAGGDRRSIGRADEVAALALAGKLPFGALFAAMFDEDTLVGVRATDAVEKVSRLQPGLLRAHQKEFLQRLPEFKMPKLRWHAAQMLSRLTLSAPARDELVLPTLLTYLEDESRLVRVFALQALADFAAADTTLVPLVSSRLQEALRTGSPATIARSRRLLAELRARSPKG